MKFELKPYNYGLTDEELIDDLRSVAHQLGKDYVTKTEYDQYGRLCSATFQKRFGSWGQANELAGLRRVRNFQATAEDCIADIRRVANMLKTNCITTSDYLIHGKFSLPLISSRLGSWKDAVEKSGLVLSPQYHESIPDEELFRNLEELWEKLGRQPSKKDFIKPFSRYSYDPYPRRFGSYRSALEAFVESFASSSEENISTNPLSSETIQPSRETPLILHKTSRNISWRIRFLVMRRDDFKCQLCGVAPATHPGTVLVIDHIKPWANGGESVMENLQTLCEKCNGGKSKLPLEVS